MKLSRQASIALIAALFLAASADAGRTGGPTSLTVIVPAGQSVYFDFPFDANAPAIAAIHGAGKSMMQVNMYDSDGNIAVGTGLWDRSTARMDVYRAGYFRIEIVNIGSQNDVVLFTTN